MWRAERLAHALDLAQTPGLQVQAIGLPQSVDQIEYVRRARRVPVQARRACLERGGRLRAWSYCVSAILLLKLLLVPALILLVTLAGRRWGPAVAGWLSAFPILSGPILLILALEQGKEFAATAAHGTLLAVLAILVFSVAYAWAAQKRSWPDCLLLAFGCYGLTALGLSQLDAPLSQSFAAVIVSLLLVPLAFPRIPRWIVSHRHGNDLPWRLGTAAALVLAVTFAAAHVGPRVSGLLAMFPVMSTVLVAFSHRESGADFAVRLLRGMVYGYFAFAAFCAMLAWALPQMGIAAAFALALAAALPVHALARRWMPR